MIYMDLTLEDNRIMGRLNEQNEWDVHVMDLPTSKSFTAKMTNDQFNAALILAMAGEDGLIDETTKTKLYEIVEPIFANRPKECRYVP